VPLQAVGFIGLLVLIDPFIDCQKRQFSGTGNGKAFGVPCFFDYS
jgi:hypothetical protein